MMLCSSVNGKSINKNRLGFTLIELSIVLVIIGLLVGGILVGRDLIQAAEIRSQISQIEEFKTAANTFKVKYGYLPGDMPPGQASSLGFFTFTGTYAGSSCMWGGFGDNSGTITWINFQGEMYAFWAHLSSANLIKGGYGNVPSNPLRALTNLCWGINTVGVPTSGTSTEDEFAKFVPKAKIASSGVYVFVKGNYPITPAAGARYYNNTAKQNIFSLASTVINTGGDSIAISASQSYQIDSKIDDGLPTSGSVRVGNTANTILYDGSIVAATPCTTTLATNPLEYDMSAATVNTVACKLDFLW